MATMNVSLPDKMKEWVESKVERGRYANVSDFMRDLIRKEQEREAFVREIDLAVEEGIASGFMPYSREEIERDLGIRNGGNAP
jgi:antitoxin ParD1/3/4